MKLLNNITFYTYEDYKYLPNDRIDYLVINSARASEDENHVYLSEVKFDYANDNSPSVEKLKENKTVLTTSLGEGVRPISVVIEDFHNNGFGGLYIALKVV